MWQPNKISKSPLMLTSEIFGSYSFLLPSLDQCLQKISDLKSLSSWHYHILYMQPKLWIALLLLWYISLFTTFLFPKKELVHKTGSCHDSIESINLLERSTLALGKEAQGHSKWIFWGHSDLQTANPTFVKHWLNKRTRIALGLLHFRHSDK